MGATAGLVTSALFPALTEDDRLALEPLRTAGIEAHAALWDDPATDWSRFDVLVMRSPGQYWLRQPEFLAWLDTVEASGPPLWNPPAVLRWNFHKGYLRDLEAAGVGVMETEWLPRGSGASLTEVLARRDWTRAVVKPAVSAAAYRTWATAREGAFLQQGELDTLLADGDVLVQPFAPEIVTEGEWSFVFFGGEPSHAFLKQPAPGEFRVQTMYGGALVPLATAPHELWEQAREVLDTAPGELLYARVDGIRRDGRLIVLELEVFEPVFYFGLDPASPARFAAAVAAAPG